MARLAGVSGNITRLGGQGLYAKYPNSGYLSPNAYALAQSASMTADATGLKQPRWSIAAPGATAMLHRCCLREAPAPVLGRRVRPAWQAGRTGRAAFFSYGSWLVQGADPRLVATVSGCCAP